MKCVCFRNIRNSLLNNKNSIVNDKCLCVELFVCVVGVFQPAEDRPRDGQDDNTQQRICLSAAGHGARQ